MITKKIRLHKKDSAFAYAIFESLEGMLAFSTITNPSAGSLYRDLELLIPESFLSDVEAILVGLQKKITILEL